MHMLKIKCPPSCQFSDSTSVTDEPLPQVLLTPGHPSPNDLTAKQFIVGAKTRHACIPAGKATCDDGQITGDALAIEGLLYLISGVIRVVPLYLQWFQFVFKQRRREMALGGNPLLGSPQCERIPDVPPSHRGRAQTRLGAHAEGKDAQVQIRGSRANRSYRQSLND
jgi:hypothetical protein